MQQLTEKNKHTSDVCATQVDATHRLEGLFQGFNKDPSVWLCGPLPTQGSVAPWVSRRFFLFRVLLLRPPRPGENDAWTMQQSPYLVRGQHLSFVDLARRHTMRCKRDSQHSKSRKLVKSCRGAECEPCSDDTYCAGADVLVRSTGCGVVRPGSRQNERRSADERRLDPGEAVRRRRPWTGGPRISPATDISNAGPRAPRPEVA